MSETLTQERLEELANACRGSGFPLNATTALALISELQSARSRIAALEGGLRAVSDMLFARPDMTKALKPLMGPAEHAVFEQARSALSPNDALNTRGE